jgi:hypothetical protein
MRLTEFGAPNLPFQRPRKKQPRESGISRCERCHALAIVRAKGPTLCTRIRASFENSHEALYAALFSHDELLKDTLP